MDEFRDTLGDAPIFWSLDADWEYWKIPIDDAEKGKATLKSHYETYKFSHMPNGLTNSPGTFQWTLDVKINPYYWKTFLVILEDIMVFSKELRTPLEDVDKVL